MYLVRLFALFSCLFIGFFAQSPLDGTTPSGEFIFNSTSISNLNTFTYRFSSSKIIISSVNVIKVSENGHFTIGWSLLNPGTKDETLRIYLQMVDLPPISAGSMKNGWIGIGFGDDMRNSEFLIIHQVFNGARVHEHTGTKREYGAPPRIPYPWIVKVVNSGYVDGILFAELSRPTGAISGLDALHKPIVTGDLFQNMIWAYNKNSQLNHRGEPFTYHGPNGPREDSFSQTHGAFTVNWQTGAINTRKISSFFLKQVHGLGMTLMFLVLMPIAVFTARYLKSKPFWFILHLTTQLCATIGMMTFFVVILLTFEQCAILGMVIISLVFFQVAFGGFTRLGMIKTDILTYKILKLIHRFNGLLILIAATVQVGLGLFLLYPYYETTRGIEVWYAYGALIAFWVLIFGSTELYFVFSLNESMKEETSLEKHGNGKSRVPNQKMNVLMDYQAKNAGDDALKLYSWDDIDRVKTAKGRFWSYIYDASQWIKSHPGGKLILYSVSGTDISLESGFDAAQFVPTHEAPKRRARGQAPLPQHRFSEQISFKSFVAAELPLVSLSEKEWAFVVRSRRTHAHTKLALERLSNLLVGELESATAASSTQTLATFTSVLFDNNEYRRYAMVDKVLLTDDGKATNLIWKVKFALLYPYDVRDNQPLSFKEGQCIEINVRLPNGSVQSRFYTPINGNLSSFEIIFKVKHDGWMTNFLGKQRPGDRQFKIRGPFGSSMLQEVQPSAQEKLIPDNLIFIAAGSGITPFLQILHYLVLPVNESLEVWSDFVPNGDDEIALSRGHHVMALEHYYDGWCYGQNLNTGQVGVFPLSITTPRAGRKFNITLVNCVGSTSEIIGLELLDAAMITYPNLITVHHFVSNFDAVSVRDGVSGFIHDGRIDEGQLGGILDEVNKRHAGSRKIVISGPAAFNSLVVDLLIEQYNIDHENIKSLGSSTPI